MDYPRGVRCLQRARGLNGDFENISEFERAIPETLSQSFSIDEFSGNKTELVKFDWRSVQTVQLCPNRLHVGDLVTASQGFPDCQDPVRGLQSIA